MKPVVEEERERDQGDTIELLETTLHVSILSVPHLEDVIEYYYSLIPYISSV